MFRAWWNRLTQSTRTIRRSSTPSYARPRLECLEDRLAPAVVNFAPGAYTGLYSVAGQPNVSGPTSVDLAPGGYNLSIAYGNVGFQVDGTGNVTSSDPLAISVVNNTLTFNTTSITIDPGAYAGTYDLDSVNRFALVSGPQTVTVVSHFTRYNVRIAYGTLQFDVDENGIVTPHDAFQAQGVGNTLVLNTTTVNIDPGAYTGNYDLDTPNRYIQVNGPQSVVVVPHFNNYNVRIAYGALQFDVDENGNVTPHDTLQAQGIGNTLRFNTTSITIDPAAYTGFYDLDSVNRYANTFGTQSFLVIPHFDRYRIRIADGDLLFDVNASGQIVSQNPVAATAAGNTLTFNTTTLNIDPNGYPHSYDVGNINRFASVTGPQSYPVVKNVGNYLMRLNGVQAVHFDVGASGNVSSRDPDIVHGVGNTVVFNYSAAVPVTIDPGAFTGTWRLAGGPAGEGVQTVNLLPGVQQVYLFGGPGFTFRVAADGTLTSDNPVAAEAIDNTIRFRTTTIVVDPGAFLGTWRPYDAPAGQGVQNVVVVLGTDHNRIAVLGAPGFSFNVDAAGNVTSDNAAAAEGVGNRLLFHTTTVTIDPGAFTGSYRPYDIEAGQGVKDYLLVPGLDDCRISVLGAPGFFFNIDAAGNVTTRNNVSAEGIGNRLLFHTVGITIDGGAYPGTYRPYDIEAGDGVKNYLVVPGLDDCRISVFGAPGFSFDVDATGNITSDNAAAAHGAGNTLVLHTTTITIDPGASNEVYRPYDLPAGQGVQNYQVVPGINDCRISVGGAPGFTFNIAADGTISCNDPAATGVGNTLRFNNQIAITIDPGAYIGTWRLYDGPAGEGVRQVLVSPGVQHQRISIAGAPGFSFSVDASGNVTSDDPVCAVGIDKTLRFNTTSVTIDPGAYTGVYRPYDNPAMQGVQSYILVPGVDHYRISLNGAPGLSFSVAANGNVSSDNQASAEAFGNTLRFHTTTINIDPGAYTGVYRPYDLEAGQGVKSFVVVPAIDDYRISIMGAPGFSFNVDANGNITSDNAASATGIGNTLRFNTTSITIDPGAYAGVYRPYDVEAGRGVQSYLVVPAIEQYRISIMGSPGLSFSVDAAGNVTSNTPAAAVGNGSILRFNTTNLTIDPGAFTGVYRPYDVDGGQGVQTYVVVPGLNDCRMNIDGGGTIAFDIAANGNVTSRTPAFAVGVAQTLHLLTATIHIDPGAYTGSYYSPVIGASVVGPRDIGVFPGSGNIEIYIGNPAIVFEVDAAGNIINHSPECAVAVGNTLRFLMTTVHIDPGEYTGTFSSEANDFTPVTGPRDFLVLRNRWAYLNIQDTAVEFFVDGDGNITVSPEQPNAAEAIGNTLRLHAVTLRLDPGSYTGPYRLGDLTSNTVSFGITSFTVVPSLMFYTLRLEQDYTEEAVDYDYFNVDALGVPNRSQITLIKDGQPIVFTLTVGSTVSTDSDGVDDGVEANAPNAGDANQDATPDNEQDNVASLPGSVDGSYVTVASAAGTQLTGVQINSLLPAELAAASVVFPQGLLSFRVEGLENGAATTVDIYLADGETPTDYYKFGPTPDEPSSHWYQFLYDGTTGAELLPGHIILHLVDGGRGDNDMLANGIIVDPGAPSVPVSSVSFDPGAYQGPYHVSGFDDVTGPSSLALTPGTYTFHLPNDSFTFSIDSFGLVTSNNASAATGAQGQLTLNAMTMSLNQGNYRGIVNFNGAAVATGVATQSFVVIPGLDDYELTFGGGIGFKFNVDAGGNVVSQNSAAAHGVNSTLFLHNTTVTIERNDYDGFFVVTNYTQGSTSGNAQYVLITGLSGYVLNFGGAANLTFDLDATGHTISSNPAAAEASLATLRLHSAALVNALHRPVTIVPGNYPGAFNPDATGEVRGNQTIDFSPGTHTLYIPGGDNFTFTVDVFGNVTSTSKPAAAHGDGNFLRLHNTTVVLNQGSYSGYINFNNGTGQYGVSSQSFVVVPDIRNYEMTLGGFTVLRFDVDAAGNVISQNSAAAVGSGNVLTLNNATVTVDRGGFNGIFGTSHYFTNMGTQFPLVPGIQGYILSLGGEAYFTFDLDAAGNVISNNPVAAHGDGSTLRLHSVTIHVDRGAYVGSFGLGFPHQDKPSWTVDFTMVPNIHNYYVQFAEEALVYFNVNADGTVTSQNPDAIEGVGDTLRFRTTTLRIDPGPFTSVYGLGYTSQHFSLSGLAEFVLVPNVANYHLDIHGGPTTKFSLDAAGNVTPLNQDYFSGVANTLRFNTVALRVDPGDYAGIYHSYPIDGVQYWLSGPKTFGAFRNSSNLSIDFGGGNPIVFDVDGNGNIANHSPDVADVVAGNTIRFRTALVHFDPGNLDGFYTNSATATEGHPDVPTVGPSTFHAIINNGLYIALGGVLVTDWVAADGTITTTRPDILSAVGNTLTVINTTVLRFDPGAFTGGYLVGYMSSDTVSYGIRSFNVVPGGDYFVVIAAGPNITGDDEQGFSLDALGQPDPSQLFFTVDGQSVVFNLSNVPATSTDADGVADDIEAQAPNGGDGNNDGIPDASQGHVASLLSSGDGHFVTVVAQPGTSLGDVSINPLLPGAQSVSTALPDGVVHFALSGLEQGAATTVTILFADGQTPSTYYKFGPTSADPTPHWYEFLFDGTTGAVITPGRVVLHLVDGGRGDADLTANGTIVDPGAPSVATTSITFDPGAYTGLYRIDNGPSVRGVTSLDLTPGTYTFHLPNDSFLFDVDPFGKATSRNLEAASRGFGTLYLNTTQVVLNQGGYRGAVSLNGDAAAADVATQTFNLVPNLRNYELTFAGATGLKFDIDILGNVTSQQMAVAHGGSNVLFLHNSTVTVERDGYSGPFVVTNYTQVNNAGSAQYVLIPGLSGYTLDLGGVASVLFDLDAAGRTFSHSPSVAEAVLSTLRVKSVGGFDQFNRSNNSTLGAGWTTQTGTFGVNNQRAVTHAALVSLATSTSTPRADVAVQADINVAGLNGAHAGLVARYLGAGERNFYLALVYNNNGVYQSYLFVNQLGVYRQLAVNNLPGFNGAGTLRFELFGQELKLFVNNVLKCIAYDASITAAGQVAMRGVGSSFDNFSATPITPLNTSLAFTDAFANPIDNSNLDRVWTDRAGTFFTQGQAAVPTSFVGPSLTTLNTAPAADVSVQANVTINSIGAGAGLVARYTGPAQNNYYLGMIYNNGGIYQAYIFVKSASFQQLAVRTLTGFTGTVFLRFEVVGAELKLFVNNTLQCVAHDTTLTAAGQVGMRAAAASIDDFSASSVAAQTTSLPFAPDTFTRADNASLDRVWTERAGAFTIQNNRAADMATLAAVSMATLNSPAVGRVAIEANVALASLHGSSAGLVGRYSGPGQNNFYLAMIYNDGGIFKAFIFLKQTGSYRQLAAVNLADFTGSGNLRFELDGMQLKVFVGGVERLSVLDGTLTTGLVGMRSANASFDNFSAS